MTDKFQTIRRLVTNRIIEKEIRDWLDSTGFSGSGAVFEELELYAIRRPGWQQVFRFTVRVARRTEEEKDLRERVVLFGCVRDDERELLAVNRTQIRTFETDAAQKLALDHWSDGMIVRQPGDSLNGSVVWVGIIFFVFLVLLLAINAMVWGG